MTQLELSAVEPIDPAAWNPYWLAFSRAHGRHPAERRRGLACDFILWMSQRWQEWRAEHGRTRYQALYPDDHAAFATWLEQRTTAQI